jgi:hypothetical protein
MIYTHALNTAQEVPWMDRAGIIGAVYPGQEG